MKFRAAEAGLQLADRTVAAPETKTSPGGAAFGAIALLVAAMVSIQLGATFAKSLFPRVGAQGVAALRLGFAALLVGAATRPWRGLVWSRDLAPLAAYGLVLGAMNTVFYMAISTIPLGVAVALEFVGPLTVAVIGSRRPLDFAWVVLAIAGILVLVPLGHDTQGLDRKGVALALGAGVLWALYIVFGKRAGAAYGSRASGMGMIIAAAAFVPLGAAEVGPRLFDPGLAPSAVLLALLSSALPYSLEMIALTRMSTRVFGTLMSLEPAVAAMAGFVVLAEAPTARQWFGIGAVMAASLGASFAGRTPEPAEPLP